MEDDPAYHIAIAHACESTEAGPIAEGPLVEAIQATLRRHNTPAAQLSVALVDDSRIAELNREHLDHEGPTDVLAFDLRDRIGEGRSDGIGPGGDGLEGELVISVDVAAREASRRGHGVDAEVALYAVHGTLHLLGYDDQQDEEAARMHELEDDILSSLGMGRVFEAKPR
jgi:probable rRNA maturation factor